jgi:hypothetical protein
MERNYSQMLRPIGQALEALGIQSFELSMDDNDFVVHGRQPIKTAAADAQPSLKRLWRLLWNDDEKSAPQPSSERVELRYSPEDIDRLDAEGRAKRGASGGAQEAHSLSQILRAAGSFVDQRNGRLLDIRKEGASIAVAYESPLKTRLSEQFTVSELYDLWVKMYLKRGGRPELKY